jgi:RHS repeat-associated protein
MVPFASSIAENAVVNCRSNHRYSVQAITDSNGTVVERYAYTPYGEMVVLDAAGAPKALQEPLQPYGYTGRRYDSETGLWYFRFRYFDSELGRFISRDPLGYVDGMSFYAGYYVPSGVDPLGLYDIDALIDNATDGGAPPGVCSAPCEIITILVELPHSSDPGIHGKGLGGHAGIGIGDDYYDYGPDPAVGLDVTTTETALKPVPGAAWWDEKHGGADDDASLSEIMQAINDGKIAKEQAVLKVEICACEEDAGGVREWWDDRYANMGDYSLAGNHCSSSVAKSINGGMNNCGRQQFIAGASPITLVGEMKKLKHTCGANKGSTAKVTVVKDQASP